MSFIIHAAEALAATSLLFSAAVTADRVRACACGTAGRIDTLGRRLAARGRDGFSFLLGGWIAYAGLAALDDALGGALGGMLGLGPGLDI